MPPLSILIKPASSACNLCCSYCFYKDVAAHREKAFEGMLSPEMMEKVTASAMAFAEYSCTFAFQGGEPTLRGLDFYRHVMELQQRYRKEGVAVFNTIQTNGTLIDEDWAAFLAENHFLVGLSLDGPADLHNLNRTDPAQKGSFNSVMKAVRLFRKHRVDFNILCVLTKRNARSIEKIFRFYLKEGFGFLQFIPCLDPFDEPGKNEPYSLSSEDYAYFLMKIFDLWFEEYKKGNYISIRHLDNWLSILLGRAPEACSMIGHCSPQFVVEGNGSVYPCDFYVLDQWNLGSAETQSFAEIACSPRLRDFLSTSAVIPAECRKCRWYPLCRNGCRRERNADGINIYCEAVRCFFENRFDQMQQAARLVEWNLRNEDAAIFPMP